MDKLTDGWVRHLRITAREEALTRKNQCVPRNADVAPNMELMQENVDANASSHPDLTANEDVEENLEQIDSRGLSSASQSNAAGDDVAIAGTALEQSTFDDQPVIEAADKDLDDQTKTDDANNSRFHDEARTQQGGTPSSALSRSRARPIESKDEFDRGSKQRASGRQLWNPEDGPPSGRGKGTKTSLTKNGQPVAASHRRRSPRLTSHQTRSRQQTHSPSFPDDLTSRMIRQPMTKPLSSEHLLRQVNGIYAGLVLVESKCMEYDSTHMSSQMNGDQYCALYELHRTLLNEHHDFLLASQHPAANEGIRQLVSQYSMPSRMWKHGIHAFLELLRNKLPGSREHMLTFIYMSYSLMSLLYETVPVYRTIWMECLGDLARYRMAIEDDESPLKREWIEVAQSWYNKASDDTPTSGRMYHHMAILSRPEPLPQLFYYTKALCVPIPFRQTRDTIMSLFSPMLTDSAAEEEFEPADVSLIRVFAILFSGQRMDQLESSMKRFLELLDGRIGREHERWLKSGYQIGIAISCLLLGFGEENNPLMQAIPSPQDESDDSSVPSDKLAQSHAAFDTAIVFAAQTYKILIKRWGDKNTLPCLHTVLVFYMFMAKHPAAMKHLGQHFPWKLMSVFLNHLLETCIFPPRMEAEEVPGPEKEGERPRPLPEDFAMRGLLFTEEYFPDGWFDNDQIENDERYFEEASMVGMRQERILWLGRRIAARGEWLLWEAEEKQFTVASQYDVPLEA